MLTEMEKELLSRYLVRFASGGLLLGVAILSTCNGCVAPEQAELPTPLSADQTVSTLENSAIDEASGLTRSNKRHDLLWMHNDSGGSARLFAVGLNGENLGTLEIGGGAIANDWEDIASFTLNGNDYLLIGDIGDNNAVRPSITFYIVEEPDTTGLTSPFALSAAPAWSLNVRYPDGARDSEGIAVDPIAEEIILLSKRDLPPRLYSIPLTESALPVDASYLGEVTTIPAPTEQDLQEPFGENRNQPTGLDIAANGATIGVLTYKDSYLFRRTTNQSWLEALNGDFQRIDVPQLQQTESGGFSSDGDSWFAGSEQLPAVLVKTKL
jgi:hypothetical protein